MGASMSASNVGSAYCDFSDDQYARLEHVVRKLDELADDRKITIVTIPRIADIKRSQVDITVLPLREKLAKLSTSLDIEYIDLLAHRRRAY